MHAALAWNSRWKSSRFSLSIVNNIALMDKFLSDVDHPAVKANMDISHLALASDAAGEISKLKGRIAHVHLSDCDGKVHGDLPPGRGVVDFPPYLKALADAGFAGTVSIELEYSPEPDKIVDWVREAYTSTDRLMPDLAFVPELTQRQRSKLLWLQVP